METYLVSRTVFLKTGGFLALVLGPVGASAGLRETHGVVRRAGMEPVNECLWRGAIEASEMAGMRGGQRWGRCRERPRSRDGTAEMGEEESARESCVCVSACVRGWDGLNLRGRSRWGQGKWLSGPIRGRQPCNDVVHTKY